MSFMCSHAAAAIPSLFRHNPVVWRKKAAGDNHACGRMVEARLRHFLWFFCVLFVPVAHASPDAVEGFADFSVSCPSLLLSETPIKLPFSLAGFLSRPVNFTVNITDIGGVKCVHPVSLSRIGQFADDEFLMIDAGEQLGSVQFKVQANGEGFASYQRVCNVFVVPGWFCVLPFVVTICVAIYSKNVLVALFTGIYVGALLIAQYNPLLAFLRAGDTFMFLALKNANLGMLLFTFFMSGMIGVVNKSDGFRAVAVRLNVFVKSSRGAQLATLFAGLLIFFDDYSNTLIIGPSLLPVTDAARVSREKLAFLVDSTSASVTSMVLLRFVQLV
jgi:hypothetical protein